MGRFNKVALGLFQVHRRRDISHLFSISEVLGSANPNIEDSRDGLSNAAVFSGRCWDKKFYRDFSTNGALVFYRIGSKVSFYVTNVVIFTQKQLQLTRVIHQALERFKLYVISSSALKKLQTLLCSVD